jgi:hypothetical protein
MLLLLPPYKPLPLMLLRLLGALELFGHLLVLKGSAAQNECFRTKGGGLPNVTIRVNLGSTESFREPK